MQLSPGRAVFGAIVLLTSLFGSCGGSVGGSINQVLVDSSGLPVATQGVFYSTTLSASGGSPPYAWSLSSGTLPSGLNINSGSGVISGTPGAVGFLSFTIQVVDSSMTAGARGLAISVTNPGAAYNPPWGSIAPLSTIVFNYNAGQTPVQNGVALMAAMNALTPGQRLQVGAGTYVLNGFANLTCVGSVSAPIVIESSAGALVIVDQASSGQNVLDVGSGSHVEYLVLRGIEWTGGSEGVRFHDCSNVWFDRNHIHDTPAAALTANSHDTDHLYLTRNEIHDTGGTGEGMYLGANGGAVVMHDSVVALNHVHHTDGPTVSQGDGIELKQGSWGNQIAENLVHDCGFPCILVDGTGGQPQNIVEKNTCFNSGDNTIQVQGECIVRNNLAMTGLGAAFASQFHSANPDNLQVVHNTFINVGRAVTLSTWGTPATAMVFANNVCYSQTTFALQLSGGTTGITFVGNVSSGPITPALAGFTPTTSTSNPLADFTGVTWNAAQRNAKPVSGSTITGAGNATYAVADDLTGAARVAPLDSGAFDGPP